MILFKMMPEARKLCYVLENAGDEVRAGPAPPPVENAFAAYVP